MAILSLFLNHTIVHYFGHYFRHYRFCHLYASIFGPLIRGGFNKLVKGNNIQCIVKIILLFADIRFSPSIDPATESTRTKRNGYQQLA